MGAYKTKTNPRRVIGKSRRGVFRRFGTRRFNNPSIHHFQATSVVDFGVVPSDMIAPSAGWSMHANNNTTAGAPGYFAFNNIPAYAEFAAMFDQYKITRVDVTFIYNKNSSENASGVGLPFLHYAVDHDDGDCWTTTAQMFQYGTYKCKTLNRPIHVRLFPKTTKMIYRSPASTAYSVDDKPEWIDMAYTDVPFYGFKWALDVSGSNVQDLIGTVKILCKYTFECRNRM